MANAAQPTEHNDQEPRAAGPALHGRAPVLYLLSGDDGLLLELGPLLGARYRTRPIDSADQIAPTNVMSWALMIDATARTDARAQAARIKQQYPLAPLLIICADGATADWASPLSRGTVSAVIERGALASEALEAALTCADLQMAAGNTTGATEGVKRPGSPGGLRAWPLIVLAVLLAVPAGWYWHNGRTSGIPAATKPAQPAASLATPQVTPEAPRAQVPTKTSAPPRTVLELLSDARVAFREEKSLLPPTDGTSSGKSALELYALVLTQDPQNEEARDGLRRLYTVASARIRADLSAGKSDEATRMLAAFRGVGIDPSAIGTLESDIAAARPRWLVSQARAALASGDTETATQLIGQLGAAGGDRAIIAELRDALDSRRATMKLTDFASHAHALIKAGALLEPATDNAQAIVLSMQQLNRSAPLTMSAVHDQQTALIERTQAASHAAQFDLAQQLLNAAAILGNGPELTAARTQLQNDMAAARTRPAVAAAPSAPLPVAAAPAVPDFVRAKPLAPLDVDYPQREFDAGRQGYVIVEFTLDANGRASDAKVVESKPERVFDDAALQAVRRGRFRTNELGDSGMSRRARLRITFQPLARHSAE